VLRRRNSIAETRVEGKKTICLVSAILAFIVLVYTGYTLICRFFLLDKWTASAWDIVEIVALALNSMPSLSFNSTCAGIETYDTWKNIVRIREADTDHLELIISVRGDFESDNRAVIVGKRYGSVMSGVIESMDKL